MPKNCISSQKSFTNIQQERDLPRHPLWGPRGRAVGKMEKVASSAFAVNQASRGGRGLRELQRPSEGLAGHKGGTGAPGNSGFGGVILRPVKGDSRVEF